jgi:hypothetical protein
MSVRKSDLVATRTSVQYPLYRASGLVAQLRGLARLGAGKTIASDEPILIIVGAGRSGNTLLRRLLMEQGRIYIPPETYVWTSQIHAFLRAPGLDWESKVALALGKLEFGPEFETFEVESLRPFAAIANGWPVPRRTLGHLIQGLYHWLAEQKQIDADWVGEKTPMNLGRIGLISHMFPEARYIYIERDGVDVAYSYRENGLYPDLASGARRWVQSRSAWRDFAKRLPAGRKAEIRYHALVADHQAEVGRLLSHFGIARRAEPIDVSNALGDVSTRAHHQQVKSAPVARRVGKNPRSVLSAEERSELEAVFGTSLRDAGYEPVAG